ncbi:hypothetical protein niasHT_007113 [Heterodera trifolii]|uniref:Uncharacterized protein n=1 Tax=Heterodera trifolii TaxID=157864 RepID=A0ABD2LXK8_9BILA
MPLKVTQILWPLSAQIHTIDFVRFDFPKCGENQQKLGKDNECNSVDSLFRCFGRSQSISSRWQRTHKTRPSPFDLQSLGNAIGGTLIHYFRLRSTTLLVGTRFRVFSVLTTSASMDANFCPGGCHRIALLPFAHMLLVLDHCLSREGLNFLLSADSKTMDKLRVFRAIPEAHKSSNAVCSLATLPLVNSL